MSEATAKVAAPATPTPAPAPGLATTEWHLVKQSATGVSPVKTGKNSVPQSRSPSLTKCHSATTVQRKCACGGEAGAPGQCDECRREKLTLQPKLTVGAPNDRFEREADRVADQVMRMPRRHLSTSRPPIPIQRLHPPSNAGVEAPPSVHEVLRSPGRPLDHDTRSFMESRFGHDFGAVRIHRDATGNHSASELGARAYSSGRHIAFGPAEDPDSPSGKALLAHELTHTVQQGSLSNNTASSSLVQASSLGDLKDSATSTALEAFMAATGFAPEELSSQIPDPISALLFVKGLFDVDYAGESIRALVADQIGPEISALLDLDPETLAQIREVIENREEYLESFRSTLQPHADSLAELAMLEANARLERLKELGEPFGRVIDELLKQLSAFPGMWWEILVGILRDTFVLWDWNRESEEFIKLATDLKSDTIDTTDYWISVTRVALGGMDRVLGAIGLGALVVGFLGGTSAGAATGGTGAGVVGGAATAGVGTAPSAAVGAGAGGTAGGAAGGGAGTAVFEALGLVSLVGNIAVEVGNLGNSITDLVTATDDRSRAAEDRDYQEIAGSIINLSIMAAFALLGAIASKFAKSISGKLKSAASSAAEMPTALATVDAPPVPVGSSRPSPSPTRELPGPVAEVIPLEPGVELIIPPDVKPPSHQFEHPVFDTPDSARPVTGSEPDVIDAIPAPKSEHTPALIETSAATSPERVPAAPAPEPAPPTTSAPEPRPSSAAPEPVPRSAAPESVPESRPFKDAEIPESDRIVRELLNPPVDTQSTALVLHESATTHPTGSPEPISATAAPVTAAPVTTETAPPRTATTTTVDVSGVVEKPFDAVKGALNEMGYTIVEAPGQRPVIRRSKNDIKNQDAPQLHVDEEGFVREGPRTGVTTNRNKFLGSNMSIDSPAGREFIAHWQSEGRIRPDGEGSFEFLDSVTQPDGSVSSRLGPDDWHDIDGMDLGHIHDAVDWWNVFGRFTGETGNQARQFMLDPKNYQPEAASVNREMGSRSIVAPEVGSSGGADYLPPAPDALPKQSVLRELIQRWGYPRDSPLGELDSRALAENQDLLIRAPE